MELTVDTKLVECSPCNLFSIIILSGILIEAQRNKHKNGYSLVFQECIQVFSGF